MFYRKYSIKWLNFAGYIQRDECQKNVGNICTCKIHFLTNFANIFGEDVGADGDLVGYPHLLPLCRLGGRLNHCTQRKLERSIGMSSLYLLFNGGGGFLLDGCVLKETNSIVTHNVRYCYKTVDFATAASQNDVCKTQGKCHKMI